MTAMTPATIGLIGFGTLARQTVDALKGRSVKWIVLLREGSQATVPDGMGVVHHVDELVAFQPQVVVEAAGQESVAAYVPALLRAGMTVVVASVGALADLTTAGAVAEARALKRGDLIIPTGAIGGLDYLATVAGLSDTRVRYTLTKPVAAWKEELAALELSDINQPVTLFEGTPSEAALLYPKNLNAAYTAQLIVAPAPVTMTVVADPSIDSNIHEFEVESSVGLASFRFINKPSFDNPKTSAVTGLSLAAAVLRVIDTGQAG